MTTATRTTIIANPEEFQKMASAYTLSVFGGSEPSSSCPNIESKTMTRNRKKPVEDIPPKMFDTCSLESSSVISSSAAADKWRKPYEAPPVFNQSTVLGIGFVLFVLALIWPPLILFVTFGASKLIPYCFRINDHGDDRRKLFQEFVQDAEDLPENFQHMPENIELEESYWVNARGMALCTSIMTPRDQPVQAVVCFCHGYTDNASYIKRVENQRLVQSGITFVTIEYEGHGRSDGPLGLINNWDLLIDDVSSYFQQIIQTRFPGTPAFLMGESMGGAVAYCTYNRIPDVFRGVVFLCPMCKISDEMLPPKPVIDALCWLVGPRGRESLLGYLPIAPSKASLKDISHRLPEKADLARRCPSTYGRNPRLATARELIHVTQRISNSLSEFRAPFLVQHGKADRVTDPKLSQALFDESPSNDKSIKLYDGMWHALTCGEPDESIDLVLSDAVEWILTRAKVSS